MYRAQVRYQGVSVESLITLAQSVDARDLNTSLSRFQQRLGYGSMLSTAINAVDSGMIDSQRGSKLWPGLLWFVPRAVWSDKPTMSVGNWYAREALGWGTASEAALTLPGDFYLNFGIMGVCVGMFLFGVGLRLAYEY